MLLISPFLRQVYVKFTSGAHGYQNDWKWKEGGYINSQQTIIDSETFRCGRD